MAHHTMLTNVSKNSTHPHPQLPPNPIFHDFLGMKNPDSHLGFSPRKAAPPDLRPSEHCPAASASRGSSSSGGRGLISTTSDLASGRDRNRRSNDDEVMQHPMRPNAASLILQSHVGSGSRLDADVTKWERSTLMNIGPAPTVQCSPRGTFVPFSPQLPTNRYREANVIPPNISQSAADEGSRTGIKGPGILSSSNPGGGTSERNSSILLKKSGTNIVDPESCIPSSRRGLTSVNRQMTIFYGGQAHVFDDVHPNKADVIMALAGSNGGSWSTNYATKSTARPINENQMPSGELDIVAKEAHGKLCVAGSSMPLVGSVERISTTSAGAPHGSNAGKGGRDQAQATDSSIEKKRDL
ncbi:protein TIFY 8 isoform X2 [Cucurbita pepo subsp. pepo]|uniref:protein TIFY 8 isoform X2 n=1 Tax=Cucurbita pepo subsp. pepo TaxID=3664 RepID=UPI000C9D6CE5|nr:protein TIFY 8 isoform X2 [Cucurbita pepo subsp. pepo]